MPFCMYCGKKLEENEVCSCAEAQAENSAQAQAQAQPTPQPTPQAENPAQPAESPVSKSPAVPIKLLALGAVGAVALIGGGVLIGTGFNAKTPPAAAPSIAPPAVSDSSANTTPPTDAAEAPRPAQAEATAPVQPVAPTPPAQAASNAAIVGWDCSSSLVETISGMGTLTYPPQNVTDGNATTAWVEGASGYGEGQWVQLTLGGNYLLSSFEIANGFQKSTDLYWANGRVQGLRLHFSDGTTQDYTLADQSGTQQITLSKPVTTSSVRFEILSVYAGSRHPDTCISELYLH